MPIMVLHSPAAVGCHEDGCDNVNICLFNEESQTSQPPWSASSLELTGHSLLAKLHPFILVMKSSILICEALPHSLRVQAAVQAV